VHEPNSGPAKGVVRTEEQEEDMIRSRSEILKPGTRNGRLEILSFKGKELRSGVSRRIYTARCDCGRECTVEHLRFTRGITKSCGCQRGRRVDLTGRVIEHITVTSFSHVQDQPRQVVWNCRCDCGTVFQATSRVLLALEKKSCGCHVYQIDGRGRRYISPLDSKIGDRFSQYVSRAERRQLAFELTRDQFKELLMSSCAYCGEDADPLNGVDRVDSSKGYVIGNVKSACFTCNRAKSDMSYTEFVAWIERLVKFRTTTTAETANATNPSVPFGERLDTVRTPVPSL
jgi:hypothetical protein